MSPSLKLKKLLNMMRAARSKISLAKETPNKEVTMRFSIMRKINLNKKKIIRSHKKRNMLYLKRWKKIKRIIGLLIRRKEPLSFRKSKRKTHRWLINLNSSAKHSLISIRHLKILTCLLVLLCHH